jgi:hypothetical protein
VTAIVTTKNLMAHKISTNDQRRGGKIARRGGGTGFARARRRERRSRAEEGGASRARHCPTWTDEIFAMEGCKVLRRYAYIQSLNFYLLSLPNCKFQLQNRWKGIF